jgi:hypothetical protein
MSYRTRAQRANLAEYDLEKLENEIGALQYDLKQAVSVHAQEEIERKIEALQSQYRMILNSIGI